MKRVTAIYFSPTGTTAKTTLEIARTIAARTGAAIEEVDITTPLMRERELSFTSLDIVVFGSPVYIGRMPNLISPYYRSITGNGALAVAVAVYGNRNFDNGLSELTDILTQDGFRCIAAGAFIGEHSFSRTLAASRPDAQDLQRAREFAEAVYAKLCSGAESIAEPIPGEHAPYISFYKATDSQGNPIDIRKVKPVTDSYLCDGCGLCARLCPMGSISSENPQITEGICIKCGACIKRCPRGARNITDNAYLSHLKLLEERFSQRKEPVWFL